MASAAGCGLAHVLLALLGMSQRQAERPTGDYCWCCDRDRAVACQLEPVRAVRLLLRLIQQDVRIASNSNHLLGVAVDFKYCAPYGSGVRRRTAARTPDASGITP